MTPRKIISCVRRTAPPAGTSLDYCATTDYFTKTQLLWSIRWSFPNPHHAYIYMYMRRFPEGVPPASARKAAPSIFGSLGSQGGVGVERRLVHCVVCEPYRQTRPV